MAQDRFLIVNADDLGLTRAVNDGIFAAYEEGIVTSASLMVDRPATPAAAEALGDHPDLAVGLHLEAAFVLSGSLPPEGRTPVEECRTQLAEVIEAWVLVRVARGLKVPPIGGATVQVKRAS